MARPVANHSIVSVTQACARLRDGFPPAARAVAETLRERGAQVFVAGGAVRDAFLCRALHDWDLVTSLTPEGVIEAFPRVVRPGHSVRTLIVIGPAGPVEVTSFAPTGAALARGAREDPLAADLAQRDFTINAMAVDLAGWTFVDQHEGVADLGARQIRCVGDPAARLAEDPVRSLRAARLVATLAFTCAPATASAIPAAVPGLRRVAWERKRAEMLKLLGDGDPVSPGLKLLASTGLLLEVAPELAAAPDAKLGLVDLLPRGEWLLRFAGWAALAGLSPEAAVLVLQRWRVSKKDAEIAADWLRSVTVGAGSDACASSGPPSRRGALVARGTAELVRVLRQGEQTTGSFDGGSSRPG